MEKNAMALPSAAKLETMLAAQEARMHLLKAHNARLHMQQRERGAVIEELDREYKKLADGALDLEQCAEMIDAVLGSGGGKGSLQVEKAVFDIITTLGWVEREDYGGSTSAGLAETQQRAPALVSEQVDGRSEAAAETMRLEEIARPIPRLFARFPAYTARPPSTGCTALESLAAYVFHPSFAAMQPGDSVLSGSHWWDADPDAALCSCAAGSGGPGGPGGPPACPRVHASSLACVRGGEALLAHVEAAVSAHAAVLDSMLPLDAQGPQAQSAPMSSLSLSDLSTLLTAKELRALAQASAAFEESGGYSAEASLAGAQPMSAAAEKAARVCGVLDLTARVRLQVQSLDPSAQADFVQSARRRVAALRRETKVKVQEGSGRRVGGTSGSNGTSGSGSPEGRGGDVVRCNPWGGVTEWPTMARGGGGPDRVAATLVSLVVGLAAAQPYPPSLTADVRPSATPRPPIWRPVILRLTSGLGERDASDVLTATAIATLQPLLSIPFAVDARLLTPALDSAGLRLPFPWLPSVHANTHEPKGKRMRAHAIPGVGSKRPASTMLASATAEPGGISDSTGKEAVKGGPGKRQRRALDIPVDPLALISAEEPAVAVRASNGVRGSVEDVIMLGRYEVEWQALRLQSESIGTLAEVKEEGTADARYEGGNEDEDGLVGGDPEAHKLQPLSSADLPPFVLVSDLVSRRLAAGGSNHTMTVARAERAMRAVSRKTPAAAAEALLLQRKDDSSAIADSDTKVGVATERYAPAPALALSTDVGRPAAAGAASHGRYHTAPTQFPGTGTGTGVSTSSASAVARSARTRAIDAHVLRALQELAGGPLPLVVKDCGAGSVGEEAARVYLALALRLGTGIGAALFTDRVRKIKVSGNTAPFCASAQVHEAVTDGTGAGSSTVALLNHRVAQCKSRAADLPAPVLTPTVIAAGPGAALSSWASSSGGKVVANASPSAVGLPPAYQALAQLGPVGICPVDWTGARSLLAALNSYAKAGHLEHACTVLASFVDKENPGMPIPLRLWLLGVAAHIAIEGTVPQIEQVAGLAGTLAFRDVYVPAYTHVRSDRTEVEFPLPGEGKGPDTAAISEFCRYAVAAARRMTGIGSSASARAVWSMQAGACAVACACMRVGASPGRVNAQVSSWMQAELVQLESAPSTSFRPACWVYCVLTGTGFAHSRWNAQLVRPALAARQGTAALLTHADTVLACVLACLREEVDQEYRAVHLATLYLQRLALSCGNIDDAGAMTEDEVSAAISGLLGSEGTVHSNASALRLPRHALESAGSGIEAWASVLFESKEGIEAEGTEGAKFESAWRMAVSSDLDCGIEHAATSIIAVPLLALFVQGRAWRGGLHTQDVMTDLSLRRANACLRTALNTAAACTLIGTFSGAGWCSAPVLAEALLQLQVASTAVSVSHLQSVLPPLASPLLSMSTAARPKPWVHSAIHSLLGTYAVVGERMSGPEQVRSCTRALQSAVDGAVGTATAIAAQCAPLAYVGPGVTPLEARVRCWLDTLPSPTTSDRLAALHWNAVMTSAAPYRPVPAYDSLCIAAQSAVSQLLADARNVVGVQQCGDGWDAAAVGGGDACPVSSAFPNDLLPGPWTGPDPSLLTSVQAILAHALHVEAQVQARFAGGTALSPSLDASWLSASRRIAQVVDSASSTPTVQDSFSLLMLRRHARSGHAAACAALAEIECTGAAVAPWPLRPPLPRCVSAPLPQAILRTLFGQSPGSGTRMWLRLTRCGSEGAMEDCFRSVLGACLAVSPSSRAAVMAGAWVAVTPHSAMAWRALHAITRLHIAAGMRENEKDKGQDRERAISSASQADAAADGVATAIERAAMQHGVSLK